VPDGAPPNVLVLISDEQRVDTLGCYGPVYGRAGNPTLRTPNVDALAAAGTRFDAYITPYPLCCPTRATLWTALHPHEHDVLGNKRPIRLPDGFVPPVAVFRDAGYHTGYVGKWHVPGAEPDELGFDDGRGLGRVWGRDIDEYRSYIRSKGYRIGGVENLTSEEQALLEGDDPPSAGASVVPLEDYIESWVTDRARELLRDAVGARRPFFVAVGWNAPHFPMVVPAPYDTMYDAANVPLPPSFDDDLSGKPAAQQRRFSWTRVQHLSKDGWRRLIAHYWGLVSLVDDQVGRLIAELERLGVRGDTIVVYTTDHGDLMGSHHLMEKGAWNVYEETVRLPLIVTNPRSGAQNGVVPELVSPIDVMPTLLDRAGLRRPQGLAGRSAARLMERQVVEWRDALFGETAALSEQPGVDEDVPQADLDPNSVLIVRWVRTHRWKYAFYSNDLDELYDLASDPDECVNLAADPAYAGIVESFRRRIVTFMEETGDPLLGRLQPLLERPAA
jgi:arylsulfatase